MTQERIKYWVSRVKGCELSHPEPAQRNLGFPVLCDEFIAEIDGKVWLSKINRDTWKCHIVGEEGNIEGFSTGRSIIGEAIRAALYDALKPN